MGGCEKLPKLEEGMAKSCAYLLLKSSLKGSRMTLDRTIFTMAAKTKAELLEILELGVSAWNSWRERNAVEWPDLSQVRLPGQNLDGYELENVNLCAADLSRASLRGANLRNVNLKDAKLMRAKLVDANLREANLFQADLTEADLSGAILSHANLKRGKFEKARFDRATFGSTAIDENIFLGSVGLESTVHEHKPFSGIDVSVATLGRTASILQGANREDIELFFRKARLPLGLVTRNWYSCFISYSHQDHGFADFLFQNLSSRGVWCWRDDRKLTPGGKVTSELKGAIYRHDKMLLCCSKNSLTSRWVDQEISLARELEEKSQDNVIIPLTIDRYLWEWESSHAESVRSRFVGDFTEWDTNHQKRDDTLHKLLVTLQPPSIFPLY
jgi:uncharacterized protein YjbI with pentapeptide repeats